MNWLGLNWQLSLASGWGVLGLNLAVEAEKDGRFAPVPFVPSANLNWLVPEKHQQIERVIEREQLVARMLKENPVGSCHCDFPVMHSLGNRLASHDAAKRVIGNSNLAIAFFEDTYFPPEASATARRFDSILAGSTWNCNVLKRNGIVNSQTFVQGIDLDLFYPCPKPEHQSEHFFIFSGGKLEFRKGQDIVIAAFREFRRTHPDAVLVTAWHNHWPKTVQGIDMRGYVSGYPPTDSHGRMKIVPWLSENGIPPNACSDVGLAPNHLMPKIYAHADVAVFANRCEGGTNLVAMECMACGVPTIISANTGHLDIIDEGHCFPLTRQLPVNPVPPYVATVGWGETDVSELIDALEFVYRAKEEARTRAAEAVKFMQDWSWSKRYQELVQVLLRA